jgi:hypothetical protein
VLVLIGATEDGTKELLAVVDGYRESTQSSRELLGAAQTPGACWVLSQLPLCYPLLGIWYLVLVVLTGGGIATRRNGRKSARSKGKA